MPSVYIDSFLYHTVTHAKEKTARRRRCPPAEQNETERDCRGSRQSLLSLVIQLTTEADLTSRKRTAQRAVSQEQ